MSFASLNIIYASVLTGWKLNEIGAGLEKSLLISRRCVEQ
jgi:hypothetical protein